MIIGLTHFKGPVSIEGLNSYTGESTPANDAVCDMVSVYMSVYEREYLERMFGRSVAVRLESGDAELEWLADMLKNEEGVSPVACYVFFKIVGQNGVTASALGATKAASDLSVSPNPLLVTAWNLMVAENGRIDAEVKARGVEGYLPSPSMFEPVNTLGL